MVSLNGEFIAIDGKTLRRAYQTGKRQGAIPMISAWGVTNHVVIRHLALNLLKREQTLKRGIAIKRKRAGWDNSYLEKLLELAIPAR